jgi:hypothetical protein
MIFADDRYSASRRIGISMKYPEYFGCCRGNGSAEFFI